MNILEAICFLYSLDWITIMKLILDPTCKNFSTVTNLE